MRVLALPFVALAGCWTLSTDVGDLSSAVATSDAGASVEGGNAEAGNGDAGSDAPAAPFCATHAAGAVDCVDFDGAGSAIGDYGFSPHVTSTGSAALDTLSLSPPRSFFSQMPATHADCAYAAIEKTYPAALHYRVSLSFRVDPLGDPEAVGFPTVIGANLGSVTEQVLFASGTPSTEPKVLYQSVDTGGSKTDTMPFASKGKTGAWSRLTLEMNFHSPPSGKVSVDGDEVPFPLARFPANAADQPHALFIALGWHCHDVNFKGVTLHVDDVLVESLP